MEAYRAGVTAAEEALDGSPGPILFLNEGDMDENARSYAMGWNTVWACDENRRRAGAFNSCAANPLMQCATPVASGSRIGDAPATLAQADRQETGETEDKSEALFDILIEAVQAWLE